MWVGWLVGDGDRQYAVCNATRLHCSPLPRPTDLFPALTAFDSIFSLHRAEIEQSTRTSVHAASLATLCRFVDHGLIVLLCARPFMLLLAEVARGGPGGRGCSRPEAQGGEIPMRLLSLSRYPGSSDTFLFGRCAHARFPIPGFPAHIHERAHASPVFR